VRKIVFQQWLSYIVSTTFDSRGEAHPQVIHMILHSLHIWALVSDQRYGLSRRDSRVARLETNMGDNAAADTSLWLLVALISCRAQDDIAFGEALSSTITHPSWKREDDTAVPAHLFVSTFLHRRSSREESWRR
jgi:hypothetical protein